MRGQNETMRRIVFHSKNNISSYSFANSGVFQPGASKVPVGLQQTLTHEGGRHWEEKTLEQRSCLHQLD